MGTEDATLAGNVVSIGGWVQVCAVARARLKVHRAEAEWIGVFAPDLPDQLVRVERARAFDADWLLFLSRVCDEEALPHRDALVLDLRLTLGTLVLDGEHYELKTTLPLASFNSADLPERVRAFAAEAVRLRRWVIARASAARNFDYLAE